MSSAGISLNSRSVTGVTLGAWVLEVPEIAVETRDEALAKERTYGRETSGKHANVLFDAKPEAQIDSTPIGIGIVKPDDKWNPDDASYRGASTVSLAILLRDN
ncbi:MAG: hypothetical protein Q9167_008029 [Letrouitia subvulpina]